VEPSTKPADETAGPESGSAREWRQWPPPGTGSTVVGSWLGGALTSGSKAARSLLERIRRILGFGVMRASSPLRNESGEPLRARAWLESAEIEERYQYSQEISLNADVRAEEEPSGMIKLVLPYDGDKYFTRQAYRDVVRAREGGLTPNASGF
jgi:hypothetical protein